MLLAQGGKILFVANANRNTVSVIDTEAGKSIETIGTAIDPKAPPGSTPNSLALSPDESMLFVANANTNDLAVVNVKDPGGSAPLGFIPVGLVSDVGAAGARRQDDLRGQRQGGSSRANRDGPRPGFAGGRSPDHRIHRRPLPGDALDHSDAGPTPDGGLFADGLRVQPAAARRSRGGYRHQAPPPGNPIPAKVGDPSPIKYVIYIVKENRTYDQVFGDMPEGNGDPNLCLFPEASHAQPPRAGPRVRAARQLLRRERSQRRRP